MTACETVLGSSRETVRSNRRSRQECERQVPQGVGYRRTGAHDNRPNRRVSAGRLRLFSRKRRRRRTLEHPDADDGPAISPGRLAEAGAAGTLLSATARNTLRMQAAVDALCGTQYDSDNGGSAELKDILRDCQFAAAQMNAVIREQNPGRLLRFCDQEVSRRCFFILDQTSVADQTNE